MFNIGDSWRRLLQFSSVTLDDQPDALVFVQLELHRFLWRRGLLCGDVGDRGGNGGFA